MLMVFTLQRLFTKQRLMFSFLRMVINMLLHTLGMRMASQLSVFSDLSQKRESSHPQKNFRGEIPGTARCR